jgi:hypothetical protein
MCGGEAEVAGFRALTSVLLKTEQTFRQEGVPDVSERPTTSLFKGQAV